MNTEKLIDLMIEYLHGMKQRAGQPEGEYTTDDLTELNPEVFTPDKFMTDMIKERIAAGAKYPSARHRFTALVEEVGELARELTGDYKRGRIWSEAVQVAALAMQIAFDGDPAYLRRFRRMRR